MIFFCTLGLNHNSYFHGVLYSFRARDESMGVLFLSVHNKMLFRIHQLYERRHFRCLA